VGGRTRDERLPERRRPEGAEWEGVKGIPLHIRLGVWGRVWRIRGELVKWIVRQSPRLPAENEFGAFY